MSYELYYWPSIQGRGEFIRLALEAAGVPYIDVAREKPRGMQSMMRRLEGGGIKTPPFAPPFLKAGGLWISQTANILMFLGARHALAPADEAGRLWANQLQLTMADFLSEIHDTHHPVASALYYEDQRDESKRRAADFLTARAPKFLGYFERILARHGASGGYLTGAALTYPDLSLFQIVSGLRYAFPNAMKELEASLACAVRLHGLIEAHPRISAYLASPRRLPFSEEGIFRHYPELDRPLSQEN
jgi:glutathione S-transferase